MKSNYVKKAAQESLQRIEKQYGPERAAKVKAARKAYGEYLFSVIGYCERCGGPIHQIDHHILREGYHLCSDCFTVLMDEAHEGQAEGTTTITISIRRAVDGDASRQSMSSRGRSTSRLRNVFVTQGWYQ